MTKEKNKYYDVIVAWASGEAVQVKTKTEGQWLDYASPGTPDFNASFLKWRVKPPKNKYRVGIFNSGPFVVTSEGDVEYFQTKPLFNRWITDWIEYE